MSDLPSHRPITGGTGRFAGATGTGTVHTEAVVEQLTASGARGHFDPLTFDGTLSRGR